MRSSSPPFATDRTICTIGTLVLIIVVELAREQGEATGRSARPRDSPP